MSTDIRGHEAIQKQQQPTLHPDQALCACAVLFLPTNSFLVFKNIFVVVVVVVDMVKKRKEQTNNNQLHFLAQSVHKI